MPGYEELTPDQIMAIAWLIVIAVSIFAFGGMARSLINLKVAKCIKFNIEREIVKQIQGEITNKKSFFTIVREWWKKRKEVKKEPDPFAKHTGELEIK